MWWINNDKSMGLNLDLVGWWTYKNKELQIRIGSNDPIMFYNQEAEDIYAMLVDKNKLKQVI